MHPSIAAPKKAFQGVQYRVQNEQTTDCAAKAQCQPLLKLVDRLMEVATQCQNRSPPGEKTQLSALSLWAHVVAILRGGSRSWD